MNALPPAGWFPDPEGSSRLRYWDGTAWTAHYAPYPSDQQTPEEPQSSQASSPEATYHYTSGTGGMPVVAEVGGMKTSTKWKIGGLIAALLIVILILA